MVSRRVKKRNGYYTPGLTIPKKELIANSLFSNLEYDDWEDHRDGYRDWFSDFKQIKNIDVSKQKIYDELYEKRVSMNSKQKKLLKRRKSKKIMKP